MQGVPSQGNPAIALSCCALSLAARVSPLSGLHRLFTRSADVSAPAPSFEPARFACRAVGVASGRCLVQPSSLTPSPKSVAVASFRAPSRRRALSLAVPAAEHQPCACFLDCARPLLTGAQPGLRKGAGLPSNRPPDPAGGHRRPTAWLRAPRGRAVLCPGEARRDFAGTAVHGIKSPCAEQQLSTCKLA